MTHDVEQVVYGAGIAAPVAFVAIYALLTVALVPGSVPSVAAGALFGAAWGTLLAALGATLGATGAFLIAGRLGRTPVRARTGARFERLDRRLSARGFRAVLLIRLVPLFPFNAVNYALGLTGVRLRDYVLATTVGILPATFAFVALGSSLSDPASPGFALSLAMVLALAVGAPLGDRLRRRRGAARPRVS
jgi:uncharacterized membrane protein YdjX (TVP38/TMEM64 family)